MNPDATALIPYDGQGPTTEVLSIMKRVVSLKSELKYKSENVNLLLWIYDGNDSVKDLLLEEWFRNKLSDAEVGDEGKKTRPAMRKICKDALDAVNKASDNCPIILPSLTFNIFSHYLTTRRKKNVSYLEKTTYGGIRSALTHLFRMSGQEMSSTMMKKMSQFMSGIQRTIVNDKITRGESLNEGKRPMSFSVYENMCKILYKGDDDEFLFAHAFLTMEWNLMARADNCVNMHVNHIQWQDDCLLFFFGKSKKNQTGDASDRPWHVYSNPNAPHLCPVLALAKYLLTHPDLLQEGSPLFPGGSQYERFVKIFHKVISKNKEEFEKLGVKPGDLGSHSTRKGSITLVSSGCTVSPPMSSICLRACWSMGNVKDRYIHYEKAGDQFCGRSATGISSLRKEFAVSPVYFELGNAPPEIENEINRRIKLFVNGPASQGPLYLLVRLLFASICFHYDDLKNNLSDMNRLRASTMFIEATEEIRRCATIRYPWNKTSNTPIFTGVPPHVMIMVEMEELKTLLKDQRKEIAADLRDELKKRHIGGDAFEASSILEEVTKVHERTLDALGRGQHQQSNNEDNLEGYLHVDPSEDHDIQEEEGRAGIVSWRERPLGVVVS